MTPDKRYPRNSRDAWFGRWPLIALLIFTTVAALGYATFGRHPEWLRFIPDMAAFFSVSFTFFARGHIWLTSIVLALYLTHRAGKAWALSLGLVYLISLVSELIGTTFGLPFGVYSYTDLLGAKWFDRVPFLIPLSWFTMAIPAYTLSFYTFRQPSQGFVRVVFAALLLTAWDLSLDPAMSYLTTYWTWGETGPYYGMPWINLFGWYVTGIAVMTALHLAKVERWMNRLSVRWMAAYYGLVILMPVLMIAAGDLWGAVALTLIVLGLCGLIVWRRMDTNANHPFAIDEAALIDNPDALKTETLKDFFSAHSRSFSFAARFFSTEQYRLVTRLYAFCRTTDDIADSFATRFGKEKAEEELDAWEQRTMLAYQGLPSGIRWLDELMARSAQSGVSYDLIRDLIAGVRTDLGNVEIKTMKELNRYTYRVASVVGIWLCYLFGVREKDVLDRASALGRAMQITNILRDVGEDLRVHRLYLPTELLRRHGVTRDELLAMEAGTLAPTRAYKALLEDLMERAEADYRYAFRGLTVIPPSFARASAVASEIYRGIHRSIRRNRYNNFKYRAYTRWYEKVFLALRALRRLHKMQKRPYIPTASSIVFGQPHHPEPHNKQAPFIVYAALLLVLLNGSFSTGSFATALAHPAPANHAYFDEAHTAMDTSNVLVERIRAYYLAGVESSESLNSGLALIERTAEPDATVQAYRAALIVLQAKHAFWPLRKMRYLNEGLPILDSLVAQHPNHVEIRYLRLLSCYYLPRFLSRSDSVQDDATVLARLLPHASATFPPALYVDMIRFVSSIEGISESDRSALQHQLIAQENELDSSPNQLSKKP